MSRTFLSMEITRSFEETNQTVVGLLNSACGELHQYVVLNSWFLK